MSVDLGTAVGYLDLDTTKFKKGFSSAISDMDTFMNSTKSVDTRLNALGSAATTTGKGLTAGLTLPILGVAAASLKIGNAFEAQMDRVSAIAGATGKDLEMLSNQALKLGADTAFSASEVALGMENLASAGFATNEIMAAMPGMLDLAASSGTDLATAADIAASTLRGFAMDAEDAGYVADVFAEAAARTNAGVTDMGEAMKYIAPVANAMGMTIAETAAAIGIMSDAGIKGSQAGTTLRGALTRLVKPTKAMREVMEELGLSFFDAQGKMISMPMIIKELEEGTKGLTQQQKNQALATLFGQEALSGMLALTDRGSDSMFELTQSFEQVEGSAKSMAETMMGNTKGSIEEMFGALESVGIKIQQIIAPAVVGFAKNVGELADKFLALNPETQKLLVTTLGITAAVGPALLIFGKTLSAVVQLKTAFGALSLATSGAGAAAGAVSTPFLAALAPLAPWALAIGGVVVAGLALKSALATEVTPEVDLFASKVEYASTNAAASMRGMGTATKATVTEISDGTKQAVGAYISMDDEITAILTDMYVNSDTITSELMASTIGHYTTMSNTIIDGLNKRYEQEYTIMSDFFAKSAALNTEEEVKALSNLTQSNEERKQKEQEYNDQISEILRTAYEEKRALTLQEQQEIAEIQRQMKEDAITVLSESEVESQIIMQRLKDYGTRVTAEQASGIIKNAEKQRVDSVANTEKQYSDTVAAIIRMRDETKSISAEQADALIADASRQKDEGIAKAQEMKDNVVRKILDMNGDVLKSVNDTTGDMLTMWDKMKRWWSNWQPEHKYFTYTVKGGTSGGGMGGGGGGSFASGLEYVPYDGFLAKLHEGEKILTKSQAEESRTRSDKSSGDTFNFYSPTAITPAQARREMIKAKKELALDY